MKSDFVKSTLPAMYSQALNEKTMIFPANYADIIAYTTFSAVGDILRATKSLEKPVGFAFKDEAGKPILTAVVQHVPSEDPEHPEGSWSYFWTFNESGIPKGTAITDLNNEMAQLHFVARAGDKYGMEYKPGCLVPMHTIFVSCLKEWLTANAKEEEETEIEMPNVFIARSGYEDGEMVLSIELLGKFVQLIKDDAKLEVMEDNPQAAETAE